MRRKEGNGPDLLRSSRYSASTRRLRQILHLLSFLGIVLIYHHEVAASKSTARADSGRTTKFPLSWRGSSQTSRIGTTNSTIRIIETERFTKNGTWVHESWSDAFTNDSVASPTETKLNATSTWLGEWKIVVSASTSRHGWKYSYGRERRGPVMQYTVRQRTWLRSVEHKQRATRTNMWLKAVRDDWNFKGFGLSLYKSLIFPQSKGVSFRLPLTYNFGVWERHPALPSCSLTVSVFHPPLNVAFNGNISIRMKWLQWALGTWDQWLPALVTSLFLTVWRGMVLIASVLLYPLRRHYTLPNATENAFVALTKLPPPQYSQSAEEWVGVTWSWCPMRSLTRLEVVGWHFYAVQMAALYQRWDWIPRHSAALGWSIVGPVIGASDLWCTASLCLSLSGFYLRDQLHASSSKSSKQDSQEADKGSKTKPVPAFKTKTGLSKAVLAS